MFVLLPLVASKLVSLNPPVLDVMAQVPSEFQIKLNKKPSGPVSIFLEGSYVTFSSCQYQIDPVDYQLPLNVTVYGAEGSPNHSPSKLPIQVRVCEGGAVYDQTYDMVPKPLPGGTCTSLGDPHYKTFDGQKMDFQGQGIYQFFSSQGLDIQTTQTACFEKKNGPSCNQAVTIRYGSTLVSLDVRKSDRLLTVAGNLKSLNYSPPKKNDATHSFVFPCGSRVIMLVHSMKTYKWIDLTLTLAPGYTSTGGICNRLGNKQSLLYGSDKTYTLSQIPAYFKSWKVSDANDLLVAKPPQTYRSQPVGSKCVFPKTACRAYPPAITSTLIGRTSSSEPVYGESTGAVISTTPMVTATTSKVSTTQIRLKTSTSAATYPTTSYAYQTSTLKTLATTTSTSNPGTSTVWSTTGVYEATITESATISPNQTTTQTTSAPKEVYTEAVISEIVEQPRNLEVENNITLGSNKNESRVEKNTADLDKGDSQGSVKSESSVEVDNGVVLDKEDSPTSTANNTEEPEPTTISRDVPPQFQQEAKDHCDKIFPMECSTIVDRDFYVQACIKDALLMGSLSYSEPARLQYMAQCKVKTEIMKGDSDEQVQKQAETIQETVGLGSHKCLNDCSGNGFCGENGCRCQPTFGGDDCSIDLTRLSSVDQETKELQPKTPASVYPEVGSLPAKDEEIEELYQGQQSVPKPVETESIHSSSAWKQQLPLSLLLLVF
jgi:hypothetical protein